VEVARRFRVSHLIAAELRELESLLDTGSAM
jgi:hypothetical protein